MLAVLLAVAALLTACTTPSRNAAPPKPAETAPAIAEPEPDGHEEYEEEPPEPIAESLVLRSGSVQQGDFVSLLLETSPADNSEALAHVFGTKWQMRPHLRGFIALVPVAANQKPGPHDVKVTLTRNDGTDAEFTARIDVTRREFPESRITATAEQQQHITDARLAEDSAKVARAKAVSAEEPLWKSGFGMPLHGTVTTEFGAARFVNNVEIWRHSGIDYAAPAGTDIRACADGVVVMATLLHASGNTVIIDHGLSLFSSYLHMQDILVEVGEHVERGQVVGTVGSTGFSTGPHLHWTMTIERTPIDPESLFRLADNLDF
jgi:murein DD-endopeptidase MepM/ murein hydrolase activator NlpD